MDELAKDIHTYLLEVSTDFEGTHLVLIPITVLTAGMLANSKLMISPEDAIKSAFDIHARIQAHVSQFQNIQFAAKIENCFTEDPNERPPEVEHD